MNRSSSEDPKFMFKVARTSVRRRIWPESGIPALVDLVFVASGNAPRCVAVTVEPMVPGPNGNKILRDDEICNWLQHWGFAIDAETQVPQPERTVNAASPIPMFGGRLDLVGLLAGVV